MGVILLAPVLIYLFLEGFGNNQFVLPVYPGDENTQTSSDCLSTDEAGLVNLSRYFDFNDSGGGITVIRPVLDECFSCPPNLNEVKRLLQKHSDIKLVNIYTDDFTSPIQNTPEGWVPVKVDRTVFDEIIRCELGINVSKNAVRSELKEHLRLVLVDETGKIRGYYSPQDRVEMDRLILEISILKQEQ